MKAWMLTWEGLGEHAASQQPFIAILSYRKVCRTVAELVELIYQIKYFSAAEMTYYANRPRQIPYTTSSSQIINGVPHADRIICGDNPHIYARKVSELEITKNTEKNNETIRWKEPPIFVWKDRAKLEATKTESIYSILIRQI